jgi:hypothetical protein
MYSATFAMIVIFGIAATNLFLGFATAILLGRGPKSLDEIERAIVVQPISLRGLRPIPRAKIERVELHNSLAARTEMAATETEESWDDPSEELATTPVTRVKDSTAPTTPATQETQPPRKLTLELKKQVDEHTNDPPEDQLTVQLQAWQNGDLAGDTPSMSGIKLQVKGELDETVRGALADAVYKCIKKQIRKDRRLLRIGHDQFAWLSSDVPPEDAVLPVERIRQLLANTRFHHQQETLDLSIFGGIVATTSSDEGATLLQRLNIALTYAVEKGEHPTCLDTGAGPEGVAPYDVEVEESECEL